MLIIRNGTGVGGDLHSWCTSHQEGDDRHYVSYRMRMGENETLPLPNIFFQSVCYDIVFSGSNRVNILI